MSDFEGLDGRLRDLLRGRRLVVEAGIEETSLDELRTAVRSALAFHSPTRVARRFPALFLAYLTAHGIFRYEAGGFWIHEPLGLHRQGSVDEIERALRALGLESFDRLVTTEGAQAGVARVLAHGGIPTYSLDDFFEVLALDVPRSNGAAADLMAFWGSRPSRFVNRDKPIKRFLDYGGPIAIDFLDRCIDLVDQTAERGHVPSAEEVGLPEHVVRAFAEFVGRRRTKLGRSARGPRLPRPVVRIDPWGGEGPRVDLPPVADHLRDGRWRLVGAAGASCSTLEWQSLPLERSTMWTVTLDDRGEHHEWALGGLDADVPLLAFDPSRLMLLNLDRGVPSDQILLLVPAGAVLTTTTGGGDPVPATECEALPALAGEWQPFRLRWLDLDGVDRLQVQINGDIRNLPTRNPGQSVRLVGDALPGVTVDALPVFADAPLVVLPDVPGLARSAWSLRAVVDGVVHQVGLDDLVQTERGYSFERLLPDGCALIDLLVRGPLGSDLRESFAVLPGLVVHRPERIVIPGDRDPVVEVSAPGLTTVDGDEVRLLRIQLDDGESAAAADLRDATGRSLALRVGVDRLQWAVALDAKASAPFGIAQVPVAYEDLIGGHSVLRIRCGDRRPDLKLELVDGHEGVLHETELLPASEASGRWAFHLGAFADTVRDTDTAALSLRLWVGQLPFTVARVVAAATARNLEVGAAVDDERTTVSVSFEDPRPVKERALRLWSLARLWSDPVSEPIDEGAANCTVVRPRSELPPGPYLVEVAVDDGWTAPIRPSSCDSGAVVVVDLGTPDQLEKHLAQLSPDHVYELVERTVLTSVLDREVDDHELFAVAPDLVDLLTGHSELHRNRVRVPTGFRPIVAMLRSHPLGIARGFTELADRYPHRRHELVGLALTMLYRTMPDVDEVVPDVVMGELWSTCPPMAARLDLVPQPSGERVDRFDRLLGWQPRDGAATVSPDGALEQQVLGMGADLLAAVLAGSSLVPERLLDGGSSQEAQAQWLIRNASTDPEVDAWGRASTLAERWMDRHRNLVDRLSRAPELAVDHVRGRLLPNVGTRGPLGWGSLPAVTLAASLHVLLDDDDRGAAISALTEAAQFAPELVDRDLVLAQVLMLGEPGVEDVDARHELDLTAGPEPIEAWGDRALHT